MSIEGSCEAPAKEELSLDEFLDRLEPADRFNVLEISKALKITLERARVPYALIAVGSTVTGDSSKYFDPWAFERCLGVASLSQLIQTDAVCVYEPEVPAGLESEAAKSYREKKIKAQRKEDARIITHQKPSDPGFFEAVARYPALERNLKYFKSDIDLKVICGERVKRFEDAMGQFAVQQKEAGYSDGKIEGRWAYYAQQTGQKPKQLGYGAALWIQFPSGRPIDLILQNLGYARAKEHIQLERQLNNSFAIIHQSPSEM